MKLDAPPALTKTITGIRAHLLREDGREPRSARKERRTDRATLRRLRHADDEPTRAARTGSAEGQTAKKRRRPKEF